MYQVQIRRNRQQTSDMEAQVGMLHTNNIQYIDTGQYNEILIKGDQYHEQWMLSCIKDLGYIPGLWVDVGAHVGNHSIYFAVYCNPDHVLAFEPAPRTFEVLKSNIHRNGLENKITAINKAIGLVEGYCEMTDLERPGQNKSIPTDQGSIELINLSSIKETVGLLKIDVEGNEHDVVRGAYDLIQRDKPELFIESFHGMEGILELLPEGYKYIKTYNNAPTHHFSTRNYDKNTLL